jgi:hypothetical protein
VSDEPRCEGCGKRPEVHGSSWCAWCHDNVPRAAQDRLITLRNALIDISTIFHGNPRGYISAANRAVEVADKALDEFPQRRSAE